MCEDIIDLVVKTPEPESAGSRTQHRFDYQNHWAICHLLELYERGINFILAVECHDDVLEILPDSSKKLNFYQIKTTTNNLNISPGNKSIMTYIGRMLCHLGHFGEDNVGKLTLISNRAFKVINGKRVSKEFTKGNLKDFQDEIPRQVWDAAIETLQEAPLKEKTKSLNFSPEVITFEVSDLTLETFVETTKGKITTFLEKFKKDQATIPFYKALCAEVNKQASREKQSLGKDDFIRDCAINKSQFDKIIKEVIDQPVMKERIASIQRELMTAGVAWDRRRKFEKKLVEIEIDLYAKSSYYYLLEDIIQAAYEEANLENLNFSEVIEKIYSSVKEKEIVKEAIKVKSELYVKANIALRIIV